MAHGTNRLLLVLIACLAAGMIAGCAKKATVISSFSDLSRPQTELTYAPIEGDTTTFRVHFYWNGSDRDGEVVRFRYAVDDDTLKPASEWIMTTAHDTTLLFLVDPVKEVKGHVFWIVAEDDVGLIDPTPAKRFFSARTVPPTSRITKGPSATSLFAGPNFTFEWEGSDPDGGETGGAAPVDSFEYLLLQGGGRAEGDSASLPPYDRALYLRLVNEATGASLNAPYEGWRWIGVRGRSKRFLHVVPASYMFALRAVDIAGATEKNLEYGRNVRDFLVTDQNPGPELVVSSSVLTQPLRVPFRPGGTGFREIQLFEGETVSFAWTATAGTYDGQIVGYAYALDDTTTVEWRSFSHLKTAVTLTLESLGEGIHFLFIRALDDGGVVTLAILPLRIVRPAFKDPGTQPQVLLVDDFAAPPGGAIQRQLGSPNYPPDAVEDAWWREKITVPLGQEFGVVFGSQWDTLDPANDNGGFARLAPRLDQLAPYRVVIWSTDLNNVEGVSPTALWQTLVGGGSSALASYLRAGGTLIVTGFQVGYQVSRPATTLQASFSLGLCAGLDEGSAAFQLSYFPRLFMGIDGALASDAGVRTLGARDFIEARPTAEGGRLGFPAAHLDVSDSTAGAKWNARAFIGVSANETYAPGLPKIEGWKMPAEFGCQEPGQNLIRRENLSLPISMPIYTYHGVNQAPDASHPYDFTGAPSPREGLVTGIAVQAHDFGNTGRSGSDTIEHGDANGAVGRTVFLGFPIYYMKDAQAYAVMRAAFAYVNASPTLPIVP